MLSKIIVFICGFFILETWGKLLYDIGFSKPIIVLSLSLLNAVILQFDLLIWHYFLKFLIFIGVNKFVLKISNEKINLITFFPKQQGGQNLNGYLKKGMHYPVLRYFSMALLIFLPFIGQKTAVAIGDSTHSKYWFGYLCAWASLRIYLYVYYGSQVIKKIMTALF